MMREHISDLLWKAILESQFPHAIRFFRPSFFEKIDWERPAEFLDKELEALYPEGKSADRRADKLAKVFLKTGETAWILVHIEVQGQRDEGFAERMFTYFVRIRERYGQRVFALAVLTDPNSTWKPTVFRETFEGTTVSYRFNVFKVLDHPPERIRQRKNPFSLVVETAYQVAKTYRLSDETKSRAAIDLARRLFKSGYSKAQIKDLLRFIALHFRFRNPEFRATFESEIQSLIKFQPTMTLEEIAQKVNFEEGFEKGIEKGFEQGLEKGIEEAARKMLLNGMAENLVANILDLEIELVEKLKAKMVEEGEDLND